MQDPSDKPRTRLSYAHENPDLREDNPLYERTGSIRAEFERTDPERAAQREAFMVKRQQPKPVLKPSHKLSYGPDRANFDRQWEQERRAALPRAKAVRRELLQAQSTLDGQEQRRKQANEQARHGGDQRAADKEQFRTKRTVKKIREHTTAHVRAFERSHGDL